MLRHPVVWPGRELELFHLPSVRVTHLRGNMALEFCIGVARNELGTTIYLECGVQNLPVQGGGGAGLNKEFNM